MAKKYRLEGKCPQCGCSSVSHLSKEEMDKHFKGLDNLELDCGECMRKFTEKAATACPEYAKDCKI
ncbi:MAG: hypothetical protein KKA60_10145 [Proteobacteria bacterium]|nr:hypothetical protein [Pseudomonadota bacterium]